MAKGSLEKVIMIKKVFLIQSLHHLKYTYLSCKYQLNSNGFLLLFFLGGVFVVLFVCLLLVGGGYFFFFVRT